MSGTDHLRKDYIKNTYDANLQNEKTQGDRFESSRPDQYHERAQLKGHHTGCPFGFCAGENSIR
jgi:hypothetical protein